MNISIKSIFKIFFDFLEVVIISSIVFAFVYFFVGQLLRVSGDSMLPTFKDSEQIIAEKISIKFKDLERGEILIFNHPQNNKRLLIKRLIALPGETLILINGKVYINGSELSEPYLQPIIQTFGMKTIKDEVEYKVPEDSYILLGDNREQSADSREFGPVNKSLIVGRAFLVFYPIDSIRGIR